MKSLVQISAAKALALCDSTEKWFDMMDVKHMNDYIDDVLQKEHKSLWRRIFGKPMPSRAQVEARFHEDAEHYWCPAWEVKNHFRYQQRVVNNVRNMAASGEPLFLTASDLNVIS